MGKKRRLGEKNRKGEMGEEEKQMELRIRLDEQEEINFYHWSPDGSCMVQKMAIIYPVPVFYGVNKPFVSPRKNCIVRKILSMFYLICLCVCLFI